MKILITGSNGQLGREMMVEAKKYPQSSFVYTDVDDLDICNVVELREYVVREKPNVIVNCAAYTAVDRAEDDEVGAKRVNVDAVRNIGKVARECGVQVVHVSTDYVFDGTMYRPYVEDDETSPMGVYGKTKLDGEKALLEDNSDAVIIRTSWLYSSFGNNFVKTMMRLGAERDELGVIFDQIGTPTYARDLAAAICEIIMKKEWKKGVYHYSNEGVCSWFDFAKEIHELSGIECEVRPIESKEYVVRTPRPHYSVLNKKKIKETFDIEIPYWKDSLRECVGKLL